MTTQHIKYYYVQIRDGVPTGVFWTGDKPPELITTGEGCVLVHHPESTQEVTEIPCLVERAHGLWYKITEYKPQPVQARPRKWWMSWK